MKLPKKKEKSDLSETLASIFNDPRTVPCHEWFKFNSTQLNSTQHNSIKMSNNVSFEIRIPNEMINASVSESRWGMIWNWEHLRKWGKLLDWRGETADWGSTISGEKMIQFSVANCGTSHPECTAMY